MGADDAARREREATPSEQGKESSSGGKGKGEGESGERREKWKDVVARRRLAPSHAWESARVPRHVLGFRRRALSGVAASFGSEEASEQYAPEAHCGPRVWKSAGEAKGAEASAQWRRRYDGG